MNGCPDTQSFDRANLFGGGVGRRSDHKRTMGEKPHGEKPHGDNPHGEKPQVDKIQNGKGLRGL